MNHRQGHNERIFHICNFTCRTKIKIYVNTYEYGRTCGVSQLELTSLLGAFAVGDPGDSGGRSVLGGLFQKALLIQKSSFLLPKHRKVALSWLLGQSRDLPPPPF